jgi:hypothetical protein
MVQQIKDLTFHGDNEPLPEDTSVTTPASPPVPPSGEYLTRDEVIALLADQQARHDEEMASVTARLPVAMVAANAGGPGVDQHQASWSLAEQEAAARGDVLDHWVTR